jgi:tetratricopeptide (TPR) repeat protein
VIHWQYDWDWNAALRELRLGVELKPNHAMGHAWLALGCTGLQRHDEAIAAARRAVEIDPLSPMPQSFLLFLLANAGRRAEGEAEVRWTLEHYPDHWLLLYGIGFARLCQGDYEGAMTTLRRADQLCPGNPNVLSWLGHSAGRAGLAAEARRVLEQLDAAERERYTPPWAKANVYAGLGDLDRAFEGLERAFEERSGWLVGLRNEMVFGAIQADPRYEALCARVGL